MSSVKQRASVAAPDITGLNVYLDSKGRTIYYNPLLKKAWYIPKFDYKRFSIFKSRYITAVAAFFVLVTLLNDWFDLPLWLPVLLALGVWGFMEYSFYKFLKGLQPVKRFNKDTLKNTSDMRIDPEDRNKTILKIALYFILGVLLVVNGYQQHYDTLTLVFCYIALACCAGYGCLLIWRLIRSSKA